MKRKPLRRKAFTLLEVLLVLAILVILGSTVTFYFSNTQQKAYAKTAKLQISTLGQLVEQYHIDVGSYPQSSDGLAALRQQPASLSGSTKWAGPYGNKEIPKDPWERDYIYESNGTSFTIRSVGPDGREGTEDDITNI